MSLRAEEHVRPSRDRAPPLCAARLDASVVSPPGHTHTSGHYNHGLNHTQASQGSHLVSFDHEIVHHALHGLLALNAQCLFATQHQQDYDPTRSQIHHFFNDSEILSFPSPSSPPSS
eukprot:1257739-Rhodomonas_salina.4